MLDDNPCDIEKPISGIIFRDEVKNRQIEQILQHRQKDQADLVMSLLQEESWQYQAFSSFLSKRDRRTAELTEDIQRVITKLNQLTAWELDRKNRQLDITNVSEICRIIPFLIQS